MTREAQIAYLAGFFDGEGCVLYTRAKGRLNTRYYLRAQAYQLWEHKEPLEILQREFGGHITMRKGSNKGKRPMCTWYIGGHPAIAFLKTLLPYLIVKREVTEHALLFEQFRALTKGERRIRRASTPEYVELCERVHRMYSFMNSRKLPQGVAPVPMEALAEEGEVCRLI